LHLKIAGLASILKTWIGAIRANRDVIAPRRVVSAIADLKHTNADVDSVKADVSLKADLQAAADATVARYAFSIRFLQRSRKAWEWDCPYAARLSKPTTGGFGFRRAAIVDRCLTSYCR